MNNDPEPSELDHWIAAMTAVGLVLFVLLYALRNGWIGN